ncbi:hypothetical protein FIBSPDRAFT_947096 [Athelia psychrophila]|uniref:DUF6593 domain-containing protein n=1 Tax=Athelia psychrophila TaxID=1759441 RepID=A0A166S728_9AGAM|nr:hypothetical protein FIBSPDRAFT_947096 [Fibularhizoctonia sp. CBS 109695]
MIYKFTSNSPISTSLKDPRGRIAYKVCTPSRESPVTVIKHPSNPWSNQLSDDAEFSDVATISNTPLYGADSDDGLCELAQIEWHLLGRSKLSYRGEERAMKDVMPHEKSFGRGPRILTAPGGRQYRWVYPALEIVADEETQRRTVALFKGARIGPTLEIMPEAEGIADLIVITFLYLERKRRDHLSVQASSIFPVAIEYQ